MATAAPLRILGDWGTSNLRLWLVADDTVIDRRDGAGLAAMEPGESPASVFVDRVAQWTDAYGPLPALLCGMVGANIGWRQTPYAECPAGAADLAARLTRVEARSGPVAIVPGVACRSPIGGPDVMRGEETQLVGAAAMAGTDDNGEQLFCLPGTHSKWAAMAGGAIHRFQTVMTGELFAVLSRHSILLDRTPAEATVAGFDAGVARVRAAGAGALPALLFEVRSRRLREGMMMDEATGFLSGLLIGAELAGIAAGRADGAIGAVTIIGSPSLAQHYARALPHFGGEGKMIDGDAAVRAGLSLIAAQAMMEMSV